MLSCHISPNLRIVDPPRARARLPWKPSRRPWVEDTTTPSRNKKQRKAAMMPLRMGNRFETDPVVGVKPSLRGRAMRGQLYHARTKAPPCMPAMIGVEGREGFTFPLATMMRRGIAY